MRSEDKLDVVAKTMPAKGELWVFVRDKRTGAEWVPSFEDLFRIAQAICYCEDEKYPNGRGRAMVADFFVDACSKGVTFDALAEKYQIPRRQNGRST